MRIFVFATLAMLLAFSASGQAQQDSLYGTNGYSMHQQGDYAFDNQGNSWHRSGNAWIGTNGDHIIQHGSGSMNLRNGTIYQKHGNVITGSDGTLCTVVGTQMHCY